MHLMLQKHDFRCPYPRYSLERVFVANKDGYLYNEPMAKGMEKNVELRLNNAPLSLIVMGDGWLVSDAELQRKDETWLTSGWRPIPDAKDGESIE